MEKTTLSVVRVWSPVERIGGWHGWVAWSRGFEPQGGFIDQSLGVFCHSAPHPIIIIPLRAYT
jgi:hypothetical protein